MRKTNVTAMAVSETVLGQFDSVLTVRRTRYLSPNAGWAVVDATGDDGEDVVLVGPVGHLEASERAHVIGRWIDDPRGAGGTRGLALHRQWVDRDDFGRAGDASSLHRSEADASTSHDEHRRPGPHA